MGARLEWVEGKWEGRRRRRRLWEFFREVGFGVGDIFWFGGESFTGVAFVFKRGVLKMCVL